MKTPKTHSTFTLPVRLLLAVWLASASVAFTEDEICSSCGQQVSVTGSFTHRKDGSSVVIEGATNSDAAFREEVNGTNFTVTITHLPAGKYTITISEAETVAGGAGERLFDVTAGDKVLAKDFDIFATAGGARKVAAITGSVEHEDDSMKGPLTVSFTASKGTAKFNTFEVKNAAGASVVSFSASELADAFSAGAARVPDVKDPPIWRDPSQTLPARENDLIRRMSLAEKVAQLQNGAPAIPRIGLPAYNYWNEALHGVANSGIATVFPEPVGMASTWNPELLHQEGTRHRHRRPREVQRLRIRNITATPNGGTGLTFWTPNINIFRDPRWGRGQETYGEDPYLTSEIGIEFVQGIQGDDPNYMLAMACAKHYAVHSGPEADRHRFDAKPSERDLFETYLPQFERAVREGKVAASWGPTTRSTACPAAPAPCCSTTCCASNGDLKDMSSRTATPFTTFGAGNSIIL